MFHGKPEVIHQRGGNQQIAQKRSQNGGPDDGVEALDVEDLDRSGQGKAASCQHHAAHDIEADPQTPGELIGKIGGGAQAAEEADEGAVNAGCHDDQEDGLPEGESNAGYSHRAPPL